AGEDVAGERVNLRACTSVILDAKIDPKRPEGFLNAGNPFRSNTRKMIEDLLLKIGKADDLCEGRQRFDAAPSVRPGILGFIYDYKRKAARDKIAKEGSSAKQFRDIRSKEVEYDLPLLPEEALALSCPLRPFCRLWLEATREGALVLGTEDLT